MGKRGGTTDSWFMASWSVRSSLIKTWSCSRLGMVLHGPLPYPLGSWFFLGIILPFSWRVVLFAAAQCSQPVSCQNLGGEVQASLSFCTASVLFSPSSCISASIIFLKLSESPVNYIHSIRQRPPRYIFDRSLWASAESAESQCHWTS